MRSPAPHELAKVELGPMHHVGLSDSAKPSDGFGENTELASRNPWFLKLADRRLDPKGLLNPYLYGGTVHLLY